MNEEALILIVRVVVVVVIVLIVGLVIWKRWQRRQRDLRMSGDPRFQPSVLDKNVKLSLDSEDDFINGNVDVTRQTVSLNPSFFGPEEDKDPKSNLRKNTATSPMNSKNGDAMPSEMLPYTIMARLGRHLSGKDVAVLVETFGLQRAPSGAYELIGEDGEEIVFTMLNVRKPGVFPEDLNTLDKLEGIMLIMQLPVGDDAVKSWETFTAMAHEMTETIDARLCDYARRPIGNADFNAYRQAAEQFETKYQAWRQRHDL